MADDARTWGAGKPGLIVAIAATVSFVLGYRVSQAEPASAQQDWLARYLAEAPAEYKRLEATVGRWEVRWTDTHTYYPGDGSRRVVREIKNRGHIVFDDRFGGIRADEVDLSSTQYPTTQPGATVDVRNPEYRFTVDSEGTQPFLISRYVESTPGDDRGRVWRQQLDGWRGLTAEDFGGGNLPLMLESKEAKIKSARSVDLNGKTCVRFDIDRAPEPFEDWVIVDPTYHWAVRSYEHHFLKTKGLRRVSVEYNPSVDVAFPRRIVQEDFGPRGQPLATLALDYQDPQPSQAKANDFTLEAFGLERPHQTSRSTPRNMTVLALINGSLVAVLTIGLIIVYRKFKRRRSNGTGIAT